MPAAGAIVGRGAKCSGARDNAHRIVKGSTRRRLRFATAVRGQTAEDHCERYLRRRNPCVANAVVAEALQQWDGSHSHAAADPLTVVGQGAKAHRQVSGSSTRGA